jgi:MFS family permease
VNSSKIKATALTGLEWRILILLVLSVFLNYVDRSNLSVGAVDVQRDLHLTYEQFGKLSSAFFWPYALFQLLGIAGGAAERFDIRWVFAIGFFAWSGATAISGAAQTFTLFFILRIILGMGESISYPSYSHILASRFPEHHRGFANAFIDAGSKSGPAVGTLLGGYFMAVYGWRPFFVALGGLSLLWLIPWFRWMPRGAKAIPRHEPGDAPPIGKILRLRPAWFSAIGLFCQNYYWYFLLTWLPAYMEKERHFPKTKMAQLGALAYFAVALSSITCGWLSDRWIARGYTPNRVRKTFAGIGLAGTSVIVGVVVTPSDAIAMPLLMLACLSLGAFSGNIFAITQTLAGPRAAGKWTGFQNGFANFAGVVAPWLTGWLVQDTGNFYAAFVVAAMFGVAGAACYVFGIGPIRQVKFD